MVILDSNILIDIFTEDPIWYPWSARMLKELSEYHRFIINPIIYAEISLGFARIEELETLLTPSAFERRAIPYEAAFLAARCFKHYKKRGGTKQSTLPDFFIGAHAAIEQVPIVTRDINRYKTYFPNLELIYPQKTSH